MNAFTTMALKTTIIPFLLNPRTYYNLYSRISYIQFSTNKIITLRHSIHNKTVISPLATLKTNSNSEEISNGGDSFRKNIISNLNFDKKEHALPFYKLPVKTLLHIYKVTKNDENSGYCKNRLYYISSRLKCEPLTLSKYVAQRTFVYTLSFSWLEKSLNVLIEKNVPADRIIRDLWVLKYSSETISDRLEKVERMGIYNLFPWMVRCSDDILNRYVEISLETRDILGENKSTQIYLANRLNIPVDTVEDMCVRIPALKTIRVTKVKKFLDYLLSEGFTVEEIANKPRIFSSSQKTVKQRIDKLRQLGLEKINLNTLSRSRKHFQKYCKMFEDNSRK